GPADAIARGISMVHQHFMLIPVLSVAENVILGSETMAGPVFVDRAEASRRIGELARRFGFDLDPDARVSSLSVGLQQRVEILKALYREARILILDEPTAVLTPQESESLFATMRTMAAEGRTVIFISHKLHEVQAVADRVTVLRGGKTVATLDAAGTTPHSLAALMVGREVDLARPDAGAAAELGPPVLELQDVWAVADRGGDAVRGVTLVVHSGEIVAVAGVAGNGQRELAETVTGMRPPARGTIVVGARALRGGDPREAIRAGVAHVPEDRLHTGVAPSLSIGSNVVLKAYRERHLGRGPLLHSAAVRHQAKKLILRFDVKAAGPHVPARQLSGGNLQKVVLGREFSGSPRVLVAASPTRGLDVAATEAVHRYLREGAAEGMGILLIGEDLDEILALADRIVVMYEGALVGEIDAATATAADVGLLMAGGIRT
ncbi:MAG TPA: ABC transporter ATP-binding protein, partial [Gaiellaceae bacterium]